MLLVRYFGVVAILRLNLFLACDCLVQIHEEQLRQGLLDDSYAVLLENLEATSQLARKQPIPI